MNKIITFYLISLISINCTAMGKNESIVFEESAESIPAFEPNPFQYPQSLGPDYFDWQEIAAFQTEKGEKKRMGSIHISQDDPCQILYVGVQKEYRKKGVAKLLLQQAVERAKKAGCTKVSGIVSSGDFLLDPKIKSYYETLGATISWGCDARRHFHVATYLLPQEPKV